MKLLLILIAVFAASLLIGLLGLYSQIPRYQKYWNKQAAQLATDDALVYVALGDSTAQGVGASSPRSGYVGRVAEALAQKHGRPVHVINLSKSGARLSDCLRDQLPSLKHIHADVVTIEIGANDMGNLDKATFENDMDELMTRLPKQTVISDVPYFGGGRKRSLEPNVLAASLIINNLAAKHGLRVAPLHQVTKERDSVWTMSMDFLHPSNLGYRNWFHAFWQILDKDF